MQTVYVILFLLSAGCFLVHLLGGRVRQVDLVGLGLFFWVLVPLIHALHTYN